MVFPEWDAHARAPGVSPCARLTPDSLCPFYLAQDLSTHLTRSRDWHCLRVACQLVELAVQADPASRRAHGARAEIYQARRDAEFSLMAKGIFAGAANESREVVGDDEET